jgi:predicted Zn-dependent protease with MMP-like domain
MRRRTLRLSRAAFEAEVAPALDRIPEPFAALLANVAVVVEDEPDADMPTCQRLTRS